MASLNPNSPKNVLARSRSRTTIVQWSKCFTMLLHPCAFFAIIARVPNACRLDLYWTCVALNAKIPLQNLRPTYDLAGRPFVGDMAVVDDVGALRQRQRGGEILLHQDDGLPRLDEIAHDHRRQSLERLVEQDELGNADERARDCQHLLLAAGKIGAAASLAL